MMATHLSLLLLLPLTALASFESELPASSKRRRGSSFRFHLLQDRKAKGEVKSNENPKKDFLYPWRFLYPL